MQRHDLAASIIGMMTGLHRIVSMARVAVLDVAMASLLAGLLAGCALPALHDSPPAWPSADSEQWQTYTREDVGFAIDVPPQFVAEQVGLDTVFHYQGFPILRVLLVSEPEARQRGLWVVGLPTGELEVDGHEAQFYSYNHEDFFTYTHTLAYVLPYRHKQLGIEFRTDGEELNATQRRILESVRLDEGQGSAPTPIVGSQVLDMSTNDHGERFAEHGASRQVDVHKAAL